MNKSLHEGLFGVYLEKPLIYNFVNQKDTKNNIIEIRLSFQQLSIYNEIIVLIESNN